MHQALWIRLLVGFWWSWWWSHKQGLDILKRQERLVLVLGVSADEGARACIPAPVQLINALFNCVLHLTTRLNSTQQTIS